MQQIAKNRTAAPFPAPGTWYSPRGGGELSFAEVLERASAASAVFLGETHDRPDVHRWQLHVAAALHARGRPIALGFEMFPRRLQPALDRWVAGTTGTEEFLVESEWFDVWGFDPELYLPLFQFCRQQRVPMLALNCYRALVTRVRLEGWDAIPEAERDGLTPAKRRTDAYRDHLRRLTGGMPAGGGPDAMRNEEGFIAAQQTWDRAFAENIAKALRRTDPPLVIGIVGRGHLEFGHGTPYQLADLGYENVCVLLTAGADRSPWAFDSGIADAVFAIEEKEPPPPLPPRLGFGVEPDGPGLRIAGVDPDTPAAKAGLAAGDRIVTIAAQVAATLPAMTGILRRIAPGSLLPMTLARDGATRACTLAVPLKAPPRLLRPGERPRWPR